MSISRTIYNVLVILGVYGYIIFQYIYSMRNSQIREPHKVYPKSNIHHIHISYFTLTIYVFIGLTVVPLSKHRYTRVTHITWQLCFGLHTNLKIGRAINIVLSILFPKSQITIQSQSGVKYPSQKDIPSFPANLFVLRVSFDSLMCWYLQPDVKWVALSYLMRRIKQRIINKSPTCLWQGLVASGTEF